MNRLTFVPRHPRHSDYSNATIFICGCLAASLLVIGLISAAAPAQQLTLFQTPLTSATPGAADAQASKMDAERRGLELEKLRLETDKLRVDNENSQRSLFSLRGLMNLLYGNTATLGIVLGFIGLIKYLSDRRLERSKHEEERFEDIIKGMGSTEDAVRIGGVVSLRTFLAKDYRRFYAQVFSLVVAHLRLTATEPESTPLPGNAPTDKPPSPLTQALAELFGAIYPLARNELFGKSSEEEDVDTEQDLNATGLHLDRVYLANADMRNAWLREVHFQGAILKAAKFNHANLECADFSRANLKEADLGEANLTGLICDSARLDSAILDNANLEAAKLSNTILDKARFTNARLKGITISDGTAVGTGFTGADLTDAQLLSVAFASKGPKEETRANPDDAKRLTGALFRNVEGLTDAQIAKCKAMGAVFLANQANL
ncbi:MAG: pentapeptide repeat-containing protein [Blastocatellia bacterium]